MKRESLRNLGLNKDAINQIMTWNGFDIECVKKKLKETERALEELKTETILKKEAEILKEDQGLYLDILKEAVKASDGQRDKIFLALL